jgi:hypothetical protein
MLSGITSITIYSREVEYESHIVVLRKGQQHLGNCLGPFWAIPSSSHVHPQVFTLTGMVVETDPHLVWTPPDVDSGSALLANTNSETWCNKQTPGYCFLCVKISGVLVSLLFLARKRNTEAAASPYV